MDKRRKGGGEGLLPCSLVFPNLYQVYVLVFDLFLAI